MYNKTHEYRGYINEIKKINSDKEYKKNFYKKAKDIIEWVNIEFDSILINWEKSILLEILKQNKSLTHKESELLHQHVLSQNFIEWRHFMNSLRDFINSSFSYLDMISYKYIESKNMLEYYWWNKELDLNNIYINEFSWIEISDYENEIKALENPKWNIIYMNNKGSNNIDNWSYWWIMSFKIILPWWDKIITSIKLKETLLDYNEEILASQLNRLSAIFKNSLLMSLSNLVLSNINSTYKDHMTWLYNKAYLEAVTQSKKYSILVIDIDNFKTINDTYWHNTWDKVIKKVSSILRKSTKGNDKICRTWGDEFVVLVPTNSTKSLEIISERIVEEADKILNFDIDFCNNICHTDCNKCEKKAEKQDLKVSLSIWTKAMEWSKWIEEMMHDADMDMYSKKTDEWKMYRGLNQIESITDNNLIIEIYHELFWKMQELWWKKFIEWDDMIDVFKYRIQQLDNPEILEKLINIISLRLRNIKD